MTRPEFVAVEVGTVIELKGETFTVIEGCSDNAGQWYCTTCERGFRNNFEKDAHASTGTHVLAWVCLHHGMEKP